MAVTDLHRARRDAGYRTAADFAAEIGCDARDWARWESTDEWRGDMPLDVAQRAAGVLGIEPDDVRGHLSAEEATRAPELTVPDLELAHVIYSANSHGQREVMVIGETQANGYAIGEDGMVTDAGGWDIRGDYDPDDGYTPPDYDYQVFGYLAAVDGVLVDSRVGEQVIDAYRAGTPVRPDLASNLEHMRLDVVSDLQQARRDAGYRTASDFARSIGVAPADWAHWEQIGRGGSGERVNMPFAVAERASKALGIEISSARPLPNEPAVVDYDGREYTLTPRQRLASREYGLERDYLAILDESLITETDMTLGELGDGERTALLDEIADKWESNPGFESHDFGELESIVSHTVHGGSWLAVGNEAVNRPDMSPGLRLVSEAAAQDAAGLYNVATGQVIVFDITEDEGGAGELFHGAMTAITSYSDLKNPDGTYRDAALDALDRYPAPGSLAPGRMGWVPTDSPVAMEPGWELTDDIMLEIAEEIDSNPRGWCLSDGVSIAATVERVARERGDDYLSQAIADNAGRVVTLTDAKIRWHDTGEVVDRVFCDWGGHLPAEVDEQVFFAGLTREQLEAAALLGDDALESYDFSVVSVGESRQLMIDENDHAHEIDPQQVARDAWDAREARQAARDGIDLKNPDGTYNVAYGSKVYRLTEQQIAPARELGSADEYLTAVEDALLDNDSMYLSELSVESVDALLTEVAQGWKTSPWHDPEITEYRPALLKSVIDSIARRGDWRDGAHELTPSAHAMREQKAHERWDSPIYAYNESERTVAGVWISNVEDAWNFARYSIGEDGTVQLEDADSWKFEMNEVGDMVEGYATSREAYEDQVAHPGDAPCSEKLFVEASRASARQASFKEMESEVYAYNAKEGSAIGIWDSDADGPGWYVERYKLQKDGTWQEADESISDAAFESFEQQRAAAAVEAHEEAQATPAYVSRPSFDQVTKQGFMILESHQADGKYPDVLAVRLTKYGPEFAIGHGYDAETGEWAYGTYCNDLPSAEWDHVCGKDEPWWLGQVDRECDMEGLPANAIVQPLPDGYAVAVPDDPEHGAYGIALEFYDIAGNFATDLAYFSPCVDSGKGTIEEYSLEVADVRGASGSNLREADRFSIADVGSEALDTAMHEEIAGGPTARPLGGIDAICSAAKTQAEAGVRPSDSRAEKSRGEL